MVSTNRVSSSSAKTTSSGTVLKTAVKNIGAIPNRLKRFWDFTNDMAKQFSRHLSKDRTQELVDAVSEEFK